MDKKITNMKIKLNEIEIEFTEEEIISYLEKNGFKIELHNTWNMTFNGKNFNSDKKYAIPINEDFDENTHQIIDKVFDELIKNNIKKFLINKFEE